jgi:DNA-binding CsgD family transcriptional regulator
MDFLGNMGKSRDELHIRNLRLSNWNIVLLFACGIIMGDLRLVDLGDGAFWLGLDSFTLELMIYSFAILFFAFIPHRLILQVSRLGALIMMTILIFEVVTGNTDSLALYLAYSFADGLCLGGAVFLFFFFLNNDERLLNMVVIGLYYIICVELLWETGRVFFVRILPFFLVGFFLVSIFTIKNDRVIALPRIRNDSLDSGTTGGRLAEGDPVGKLGMAAVFSIYAIYMAIEMLYVYLVYDSDYVLSSIFAIGGFLGIALILGIQLLLNRNVWYSWFIFLICALLSMGLLALDSPLSTNAGSFLYGVAYDLGYISVFYLVGGAVALSGSLRNFRVFCVVEFAITFIMTPGAEYLFVGIDGNYNAIALGIMIVLCAIAMGLSPILNRRIFMTDWVSGLSRLNPDKYAKEIQEVGDAETQEPISLTPREREIFTLLLTDAAPKQIAYELKISKGTYNYHSANLYRKLEITSRLELVRKYSG